jgi:hypothetical protein
MTISRMQMERQLRAGGGLMTLEEPRQGFFLGKIVRKAKRAVKKVVKSPLGKLALGAAALKFGGPGIAKLLGRPATGFLSGQFTGPGGIFSAARGLFDQGRFLGDLVRTDGVFSPGKAALLGLGAAGIAAPFLMGGDEEEVVEETPFSETPSSIANIVEQARNRDPSLRFLPEPRFVRNFYAADGGLADVPRMPMQEGGIMDLGGMEKDYRTGGFVDLGAEERADDVPARLSKNEFVFTADAVRNAGGGDIDKGAEVMQNMMDNLEAGGMISEESQGMNPAQEMFDQSQMLESRIV